METAMVFLAAAVIAVPVFKKFRLGAILGYLIAGVVIGPSLLNWVTDPNTILHVAELGVVLLLFVIGLELEPQKLWQLRDRILLTGGSQLLISATVLAALAGWWMGWPWQTAVVVGLAIALSSTAFAIQLMSEQGILRAPPGQSGFAILLMQDLAVIPILLLVSSLAPAAADDAAPIWVGGLAIIAVLLIGRYLLNPFLRIISRYGSAEIMTAAALLIVLSTSLGMAKAGLSAGLGAFVAGMLLANSSFKHQLETEIEPFKGLLLGLFFIAIGMNIDLALLWAQPVLIVGAAVLLVLIKTAIIFAILRANRIDGSDAMRVALMLSQGGEFAFVVMAQASSDGLIAPLIANQITLVVGLSMALTSPLVILYSQWFNSRDCPPVYDSQRDTDEPRVLIAGFGRFGQITARILAANHIPFTALDKDAQQIEFVRQFGNKVFFGDASRLDLLRTAGIEHAKILLIAVDDEGIGLKIADIVRQHYPDVHIVARARNRMTVRRYAELGIRDVIRELFDGSVEAANHVLRQYGFSDSQSETMTRVFREHDAAMLAETLDKQMDMQALIARSQAGREELQSLFSKDHKGIAGQG